MMKLVVVLKNGAALQKLVTKPLCECFSVGSLGDTDCLMIPDAENPDLIVNISEISAIITEDSNSIAIPQPNLANVNANNLRVKN